jgi:hypothetical protein
VKRVLSRGFSDRSQISVSGETVNSIYLKIPQEKQIKGEGTQCIFGKKVIIALALQSAKQ